MKIKLIMSAVIVAVCMQIMTVQARVVVSYGGDAVGAPTQTDPLTVQTQACIV